MTEHLVHRLRNTDGFLTYPILDEDGQRDGTGFRVNTELFCEAADEIERLRSGLRAIEQLADPLAPCPGALISVIGRMAYKALE